MFDLKNKKAGERVLSPMLIFICVVIGILLSWGFYIYFSSQADVRSLEADILATKLLDCISENFDYSSLIGGTFDAYTICSINKEYFESSEDYYVSVSIRETTSSEEKQVIKLGEGTFKEQCLFQKNNFKIVKNFPQCSFKESYYFSTKENKDYLIEVIAASNQI